MYHISSVEIKGIWGKQLISTSLFDDVNIFIGKNGTGKTTFINIMHAVLIVDLAAITEFDFSEITIKAVMGKSTRTIYVAKNENEPFYGAVKYKIGKKVYDLPLMPAPQRSEWVMV